MATTSDANGPTNTTSNPAAASTLTAAQQAAASGGYQSPGSATSAAASVIPTKLMTLTELAQQEGVDNPNIDSALLPSSPKQTTTAYTTHTNDTTSLLNSLAQHFNIKVKTGQNLANQVIVALDKHYKIGQGGGGQGGGGGGQNGGIIGSVEQGAKSAFPLGKPSSAPFVSPREAGHFFGEDVPGAVEQTAKATGGFLGKVGGVVNDISGDIGKALTGPGAVGKGPAQPKGKPGAKETPPPPPKEDKTPNQSGDGLTVEQTKAIAAIAKKAGITTGNPGQQLAAMAKDLGAPAVQSPSQKAAEALSKTSGQSAATAYASFTKDITNNPKDLASWQKSLQQAGLLDPNQAADATAVSNAYGKLLVESVKANQSPDQVLIQKEQTAQNMQAGSPSSEMAAGVQSIAQMYGVNMTPDQIGQIVAQYPAGTTFSAVEESVKDQVVNAFDPSQINDPNSPQGGIIGTAIQDVKALADQYQVPMADISIGNIIKQALISTGVSSANFAVEAAKGQIQQILENQAAGLYPSIAPQIQNGYTVKDITSPYDQLTQQYTGKDAASILHSGAADPYSAFLQGSKDPKTGQPSMMTLDQWKQTLMSDPQYGFQKTQGAKNMAADFTSSLLSMFGAAPTGAGTSFSQYTGTPGSANT